MRLFFLFILVGAFVLPAQSQITLTINISELENSNGQILLEFNDSEGNFIQGFEQKIVNKSCTIVIPSLKAGIYSFKYFHDENLNQKLDTNWLGIPTEGFGFSNNAKATFGPPSPEKTVFQLDKNITVNCKPQYF